MPVPATDTAAAAQATEPPLAPRHHQGRLAPAALLGQPRPA